MSCSTPTTPTLVTVPVGPPAAAPTGPEAIALDGVRHAYGPVETLRGIDLRLPAGELVALLGPSGSGKTTLLAIAGGLLRPSGGRVLVRGDDLYDDRGARPAIARRAAFILQASSTIPFLTVEEQLLVRTIVAGRRITAADRARAAELLDRVGLGEARDRLPAELSGGERQRVCVAAALATGAPLVLADEPTASLDRARGRDVMALLREHTRASGAAVLVATHDERALDLVDRVVRIEDGAIAG